MSKNSESFPKLSLCMIVKNERQNLPRCLASVKPYVDEMIVVDTGSDDGTPEIALQYGATVKTFEWCDNFAAARNYAISQAAGDWILMLDADEELLCDSDNFWQKLTLHPEIKAYLLTYIEVNTQEEVTPSLRVSLFRNTSDFRYVGRFHELVKYRNSNDWGTQLGHLETFKVLHHGFSQEKMWQKNISRNIPMLERIRREEGLNLMLLYTLAKMYDQAQQKEKAQECYAEAFERLLPNLIEGKPPDDFAYVLTLLSILGSQFLQQKDYETARLIYHCGMKWCSNYPPLYYLAGAILIDLGFPLGAKTYFEKCLQMGREGNYYKYESFGTFYMTKCPAYALGCMYLTLKRPQEALAAFELALSFDTHFTAAQQKIDQIKQLLDT